MGISKEIIDKVLAMTADGYSVVEIAKHFGIKEVTIRNIITRDK